MSIDKKAKTNGHGGKRNGAGQPPFVQTDQERWIVMCLRGGGMTTGRIAHVIRRGGIPRSTLEKHFKYELDHGMDDMFSECLQKLFGKIQAGEWQALRFALTHRFGFSETIVVDSNVHLTAEKDLQDELERDFDRIAASLGTAGVCEKTH